MQTFINAIHASLESLDENKIVVNEIASVLDLITRVFLVTSLGCPVKFRSGRMS